MITLCQADACCFPEAEGGLCVWHIACKEHASRVARARIKYLERRPSAPEMMDAWWRGAEEVLVKERNALRARANLVFAGGRMVAFGEWLP